MQFWFFINLDGKLNWIEIECQILKTLWDYRPSVSFQCHSIIVNISISIVMCEGLVLNFGGKNEPILWRPIKLTLTKTI